MIRIEDLVVRYPDAARPAVDGISLRVGEGELFGLLGPNGAGKTTTLRVLAGLLAPTSGRVEVNGVDVVAHPAAVRRLVGFLPDHFGLYEDLTCREYLEFFAAARGLSRAQRERTIEDVLGLTDLLEKADVLAASLSRGMGQRLGLARVLVDEPRVLLLDEPASGLDPRARKEVREILRELARMGRTVILSSHVLSDVAEVCSSIGIVDDGRLPFAGTVGEALHRAGRDLLVLFVAVREGPEALRAALTAAPELGDWRAEAEGERLRVEWPLGADGSTAALALSAGRRAAGRLAAVVSRAGLHLEHLATEPTDLEGSFLRLTGAGS